MTDVFIHNRKRFVMMTCGGCGVDHAMPEVLYDRHVALGKDGPGWTCPNKCSRIFRASEADELRRERDRLKQDAARLEDNAKRERELREAAERSASARKGVITRLKNRAAAGVCPCCNRSFQNLRNHMSAKHPGFVAEEVA